MHRLAFGSHSARSDLRTAHLNHTTSETTCNSHCCTSFFTALPFLSAPMHRPPLYIPTLYIILLLLRGCKHSGTAVLVNPGHSECCCQLLLHCTGAGTLLCQRERHSNGMWLTKEDSRMPCGMGLKVQGRAAHAYRKIAVHAACVWCAGGRKCRACAPAL